MSYQAPPPPYSQAVPGYYQPPQQHIHVQSAAAPPPGPTVIIQTTAPTVAPVSNEPATLTCPSCHAVVRTTVIHQPSSSTHLWALILCLFIEKLALYFVNMSRHVESQHLAAQSIQIACPSCGQFICTEIKYSPTIKTHLMAAMLCALCCWPCVCVPYCMNSCQNANHYCPNCNAYIGTYSN